MPILYTFYGDDFTGSTDVLEQLASNGIPAVLFLRPPTPEDLAAFPNVQAIGIAGDSRSRSPEWMTANLPAIFTTLAQFQAPITHYKVCSTFDSSPQHGSIGRAIELALATFNTPFVPIVVAAAHLRRYVAFGHLFASAPDGQILRIDRHPMSRHPVTPMRESDLRLHLRAQTQLSIGLVPIPSLTDLHAATEAAEAELASGTRLLLFDSVTPDQQSIVGQYLWSVAQRTPLFSASSSGLTSALIAAWKSTPPPAPPPIPPAKPLLVLSGSCAAGTERQIRWALTHGFHGIPVFPDDVLAPQTLTAVLTSLTAGQDTIVYTALGPTAAPAHGDTLGIALGTLLAQVLTQLPIRRVLLCGGDTSSHAIQQLSLTALTWLATLQPGAPLCLAHGGQGSAPLELVLKGGQVGTEDFFALVKSPGP